MLEVIRAIVLGIVEGLTEFLPISSTGHLIVAQDLMNYKDTAAIFAVVIQSGAIAAVIWLYRHDLIVKTRGLLKRETKALNFWRNWVLATIPAALVGYFFQDTISLYALSLTVGWALIIGGFLILLIEKYHRAPAAKKPDLDRLTLTQSIKVGLFQCLALIPGVSRSGATIMGGLLSGLDRVTATVFSFYLSIPILVGASLYQLVAGRNNFDSVEGGLAAIVAGTIAAFITALIAIKWLLSYVASHDFKPFAYYRIILGLIILIAIV